VIDTYSPEWRRICEARWVLLECRDQKKYLEGVREKRGAKGHQMLVDDIKAVRPHIDKFTKRIAAELIARMTTCESAANTNQKA
jgi:hypothetical protein